MKYTGRNGTLRIYDSAIVIAQGSSGTAQANMSCFVYVNIGATFTDKTAEAYADDASYTGNFWNAASDKIYVGCTSKFAMIKFLQGGGVLAIGSGVLLPKYYNGSSFTALSTFTDGTAAGGDTLAQDGYITFPIPPDWALRGNANLDADKYYIELAPTAVPSTKPSADILAPIDGQYFDIVFSNMDFSGPIGRPSTEEILVMNRDRMSSAAHYIEGEDNAIYEPLSITGTCSLDDTSNYTYIFSALQCDNPNIGAWTSTGTTAKGSTQNDGSNNNPSFADSTKKAVNVQILFSGGTYPEGWAYYETFFLNSAQSYTESADGVSFSFNGMCYGVIERIHGLGVRY